MRVVAGRVAGLLLFCLPFAGRAATVVCNPPASPAAVATCNSPDLLALLKAENDAYQSARRDPSAFTTLGQEEGEFIAKLQGCGSDVSCLREAIQRRRVALPIPSGNGPASPESTAQDTAPDTSTHAATPVVAPPAATPPTITRLPDASVKVAPDATTSPVPDGDDKPSPAEPGSPVPGLIILAIIIAIPALLIWRGMANRRRAREAFWAVAREHEGALARQFLKLVQQNAYGVQDRRRWEKELKEFYRTRMIPEMIGRGIKPTLVSATIAGQDVALDRFAEAKARTLTSGLAYNPKMSPLEFEQFCAAILERNGWITNLTPGSGDQGVDIFAKRGGENLVVQCKLYSGPVGNKAVQEAHTAKVHMGASRAAVVTNAEFTPQAQQLAATTGTELLHYTQLGDL